ncbi:MAG: amidohydrolase [Dehalococcoidia bacterium]|nr:MAG: amidohydrolase [Dehalococcoidia bacterium]
MAAPTNGAIDVWAQPGFPQLLYMPEMESLRRWAKMTPPPEGVPIELTLAEMDATGVEKAFLRAWMRPEEVIISNDDIAAIVQKHPDRFLGMATVDPRRPMDAVRELERAVKELGLRALHMLPWIWNLPPNNKLYYPLFVKCIELGIPFCAQVGHTGPLCPSEPGRPIPYIDEVALAFPELTIVGGHIGYPWTDEMIALAVKYPNVYIDTSAHLPKYYPPQLVQFMNSRGQDKVMFATNYPMLLFTPCMAQIEGLGLKPEAQEKFLRLNAMRVFGL